MNDWPNYFSRPIPDVITDEVLVEQYKQSKAESWSQYPALDDNNDPDKLLRLAIGAWDLHLWVENVGFVIGSDGKWVSPEKAKPEDVIKIEDSHYGDHFMSEKIPNFDGHKLIDLHYEHLEQAKGKVDDDLWKAVDKALADSSAEGGGDSQQV